MIDITGQKVLVPAILFAALSLPYFQFKDQKMTVLIHAVVLGLLYFVISKFIIKITTTKADLVVPAILFLILTPGVLLTLPPRGEMPVVIAVHTFVFAIVFATLRSVFPQYY
jgi:uncharacterized membrane protein (UPF0136 family)